MEILKLILGSIDLLKVSDEGQKRKNLRAVKRTRRQLYRTFKKDGINEAEKALLDKLDSAIVEAAISLNEF